MACVGGAAAGGAVVAASEVLEPESKRICKIGVDTDLRYFLLLRNEERECSGNVLNFFETDLKKKKVF